MPTTLSKGYKTGNNGDRGWFSDVLNFNFLRLNSHKHDGLDSEKILGTDVVKSELELLDSAWVAADLEGMFKQTVTLATLRFPQTQVRVYILVGGICTEEIPGCVVVEADDTYSVYVNDNTLALKVFYA